MEFYATVSSSWWGTTTTPAAAIMQVTETGWDAESVQQWYVKYTGKYQNDLVFAGDYKLDFSKLNVYNQEGVTFSLKCLFGLKMAFCGGFDWVPYPFLLKGA